MMKAIKSLFATLGYALSVLSAFFWVASSSAQSAVLGMQASKVNAIHELSQLSAMDNHYAAWSAVVAGGAFFMMSIIDAD